MVQRKFDFSAYFETHGAQLPPQDVVLFYYDICFDHACGNTPIYVWSNEVENFLIKNGIIVEERQNGIPSSFEDNKIFSTCTVEN